MVAGGRRARPALKQRSFGSSLSALRPVCQYILTHQGSVLDHSPSFAHATASHTPAHIKPGPSLLTATSYTRSLPPARAPSYTTHSRQIGNPRPSGLSSRSRPRGYLEHTSNSATPGSYSNNERLKDLVSSPVSAAEQASQLLQLRSALYIWRRCMLAATAS